MKDRIESLVCYRLEELFPAIDGIGCHDQAVPLGQAGQYELLQRLRPSGTCPCGEALSDTVLQHPGQPFFPFLTPLASHDALPLIIGNPSPSVIAELVKRPARHVEKDREGPRRRREIRIGAVRYFSDQLGQGRLRIEQAGLSKNDNLGAGNEGRGKQGLADRIDA